VVQIAPAVGFGIGQPRSVLIAAQPRALGFFTFPNPSGTPSASASRRCPLKAGIAGVRQQSYAARVSGLARRYALAAAPTASATLFLAIPQG
jgi:hypothetical protein